MNNLGISRKSWVILAGTILIVAASLFLYFVDKNVKDRPVLLEVTTTELGKADIPSGLPDNLPSEIGSRVLQNYESRSNDGRLQSTRQITSKKEPRAALDTYVDFFTKIGYEGGYSESASTAGGQQIAQMKKGNDLLMIVATPDGANQNKIELTLTQQGK